MPSKILYDAAPSLITAIHGDSTSPSLKGLSHAGRKLGSEIDNASGLNQFGVFELQCRGASTFDAGGQVELYLIPAADGSNYADGDDSTQPPSHCLAGVFPLRQVSTQQRVVIWGVTLPPTKFKPLLINRGGVAFTSTDDENILKFGPYNDEVQ